MIVRLLSARDLAGLPGMPSTPRAVRLRASRENWASVEGDKGQRWPIEALPQKTQLHLLNPEMPTSTEVAGRALGGSLADVWSRASKTSRERAIERVQVLRAEQSLRDRGMRAAKVYEHIEKHFGFAKRNVCRWRGRVEGRPENDWPALLLPKYKPTVDAKPIQDDAWDWFLSDYHRASRPAMSACYRRLLEQAARRPDWGSIPSLHSLRRRYEREIPPSVTLLRRHGEDALEQRIPAQRRDKSDLHALAHVNADGHRFDVMVEWPMTNPTAAPRVGRPILVAWQDIYSDKIVGWRLDETENSDSVRLAFADMVRDFGIPYRATVDNGHAFASKRMTGGILGRRRFKFCEEEVTGIYKAFGVDIHFATPYRGQSKPIERCFRDLCEEIAKHPACAGAYTGNSPTNKPHDYGTRAMPYADFAQLVADQIAKHNAREGRRTAVAKGRSFDQAFDESYNSETVVIRRATEAQIRWLLLPIEGVKVSKDEACISLMGNRFFAPELLQLRGKAVTVRFDPYDVHAGVYVFTTGTEPLCHAHCILPVGFADAEAARRDGRARRALLKAEKTRAAALGQVPTKHLANPDTYSPERPKKTAKVVALRFGDEARVPAMVRKTASDDQEAADMLADLGRSALQKLRSLRGA